MECDSNLRRVSVVCRTSKIVLTTAEAVAMQNMKVQERFQMDAKLSNAHFHHSIIQNVETIPFGSSEYERSSRFEADSNDDDDDELVKYMSNLPTFLRKPETAQDMAFSVGVLDWGRLEKWQNRHKQTLPRNTRYSMSCSSASSSFSTELSSSNSRSGQSCSPTQQRIQRLTLQSHLLSSPRGSNPQLFDPLCENRKNRMHNLALRRNKLTGKLLQAVETVGSQNNGAVPCIGSRTEGFPGKDVKKVSGRDCGSILESFHAPRRLVTDPEMSEKPNKVVILMPRGASKQDASESAVTQPSDLRVNAEKRTVEMRRRGTTENVRGAHGSKFLSEIPRPISSELDLRKKAQGKRHGTMDMANLKHGGFHRPPPLTRVPVTQSVVRTTEMRKPSAKPPPLDARLLRGSDSKTNASFEKARSSSPLRRLGHGMAKIVKNSSLEGATGNQHDSARSRFEKAEPPASRDTSIQNKSNSAGRSRSSPMRRLLDPILKPKTSDSHNNCDNPLLKSSIPNDVLCGRAAGQPETMNLQSAKTKRDIAGCRMIHINDNSHLDKRNGLVTVQALLRVASKDGLPLLTFAVDNDSDILAATMKNSSSSEKDHHGWSYAFFTIGEVRKKNGGWIAQGGKSKVSNYVPNFVAHMKVSDIEPPASRLLEEDSSCLREFVLLSVDRVQQEWNTPDFQPHDELAAIVTKTPMHERLFQNQCGGACDPYPGENLKDQSALGIGGCRNTTVILPSGSHSLPSSGGPSSLIERWRSGGSCDCGGWDVGCKLKILSSDDHLLRKLNSVEASSSEEDSFSLFSQADTPDEKPVFSLTAFKDKIYSVEFKSWLSVLQAFSICIAVLDNRKLIGSLDDRRLCKVKSGDSAIQPRDGGIKLHEHAKTDTVSVKYISYPPLSPVGRV